jgi:hypothetical protein
MVVIDDDGRELQVPDRLVEPVRWLVTEAAGLISGTVCSFKVIIHLGRGRAPAKTVIERHQVL